MPFTFNSLEIPGLIEIKPRVFADDRGYFLETYHASDYAAVGIPGPFVQDNQSKSVRGVLRGLHFQKTHPQGKLVRAVEGEVFDVAVDLRRSSPTYGRWAGVKLSASEQNQFWVPPGFAHGFIVLSETAVFAYKCTELYHPEDEAGLCWNDPKIGINWPETGTPPRLSAKDEALPNFNPDSRYFQ